MRAGSKQKDETVFSMINEQTQPTHFDLEVV